MAEDIDLPTPFPFVSVVVISRDRRCDLEKAVASLKLQDYPKDRLEIVIVEEGDYSNAMDGVNYIYLPRRNLGLGYARNTGVRNAKGEIIAFTDDDCLHEKNWLSQMVLVLLEKEAGGVAGATLGQPGNLIGKCEEIMGYPGGGLKRFLRSQGKIERTNLLSGCNCAYRKEVFRDFQFKEDSFGKLGGDDYLLGLQVSEKYGAYFNPHAIIYHKPRGDLFKIIKWFYRRRINEFLIKEYESKKNKIGVFLSEVKTTITLRLLLWIILAVGFGSMGFAAGLMGFFLILIVTIFRHLNGIRHHKTPLLFIVLPVVKLSMDVGILKAEWGYLFSSKDVFSQSLKEYNRK